MHSVVVYNIPIQPTVLYYTIALLASEINPCIHKAKPFILQRSECGKQSVCLVDPWKIFAVYPFTSISHTSCPQQIMHSSDTQLKYKWDVSFCSFTQQLPKAPASRHGWRDAAVCACMMKENRITDQSDHFFLFFFFWCSFGSDVFTLLTDGQIEKKHSW